MADVEITGENGIPVVLTEVSKTGADSNQEPKLLVLLGYHVHLDHNAIVGHDTIVGAYSRLNPAACVSGAVAVGEGAYIGAAAVVLQGLTLGAGCIIGAGAVAVRDVEPGTTVKGVPAR